jgi:predicted metal-dependent phosphoesterase TrpH
MDVTERCYDLHSHSTASDGTLSPAALVQRAVAQGVDVLALTDHDVLDGLAEAGTAARELGLTLIPGVEISVTWASQVIHIVALGIDAENEVLMKGLSVLRELREARADEMGRRLAWVGIAGAAAGARALAGGQIISRTHFARFLIEQGHARDFKAAFRRYLKRGRPGYVACDWVALDEALSWIRQAGGQAVIAHPARYSLSRIKLQALVDDFKAAGGCALEVVSSSHNPGEVQQMAQLANQNGLLSSVGSDFHTPEQSWGELGRVGRLPPECTPIWNGWQGRENPLLASV